MGVVDGLSDRCLVIIFVFVIGLIFCFGLFLLIVNCKL